MTRNCIQQLECHEHLPLPSTMFRLIRALEFSEEEAAVFWAEPERLLLVTKMVYPEVAKLCGTSWNAVERNIRTVCGIAWKENRPLLEQLAHKHFPQKPHNTQFLAILLYSLPPGFPPDFLTQMKK